MEIHLSCVACGYELDAQTGKVEANDGAVREAVVHLKHSEIKDHIRASLESAEEISLECAIYRCRGCGAIHPIIRTRMRQDGDMVCPPYNCESCGKRLGKLNSADLNQLACPRCKAFLRVEKQYEPATNVTKRSAVFAQARRDSGILTGLDQFKIMQTALWDKPFSECPIQGATALKFYNGMIRDIERHPGAVFMPPEVYDEDLIELESTMFEEMDLK